MIDFDPDIKARLDKNHADYTAEALRLVKSGEAWSSKLDQLLDEQDRLMTLQWDREDQRSFRLFLLFALAVVIALVVIAKVGGA